MSEDSPRRNQEALTGTFNQKFSTAQQQKHQESNIRFVGTGTTKDEGDAQWKLENRNKHLKHQQALLDQIHLQRKMKDQEKSNRGKLCKL